MNNFDLFLQRAKEAGKRLVCLAAVVALAIVGYAEWRASIASDSSDETLRQTNALISTINTTAAG